MKKLATSIIFATAIAASPVWAQTDTGAAAPAAAPATAPAQGHNDAIVKMRQEIAAARKEYKQKVAAAQKVFDEQKAAAAKERDAAISSARAAAGQKG